VVEHLPGLYSLYFHMSGVTVGEGDFVEKGQRVGSLGMTGLATGPHLHWEVQAGGVAVDPDCLTAGLPFVPGRWPVPAVPVPEIQPPLVQPTVQPPVQPPTATTPAETAPAVQPPADKPPAVD
jgi:murein DD-endopeptidase MepM/ murein hydrolase activator NlpD